MSSHPIADALESGRTVMETGFTYAMQLTDVRCEKINELEQKLKEEEAQNTNLKFRLVIKHAHMMNVKQFYIGKIQQLQNNLKDATARLETKSKDVEKIVWENDKLGNKVAEQAGIISQFSAQRRMDPSVAQSQQSVASKKINETPSLLTPKTVYDALQSVRPIAQMARQPTPPSPTEWALRKRGRKRKNLNPLIMRLPSAPIGLSDHQSVVASQSGIPSAPIWPNQEPGTSGSGSSGHHYSSD